VREMRSYHPPMVNLSQLCGGHKPATRRNAPSQPPGCDTRLRPRFAGNRPGHTL